MRIRLFAAAAVAVLAAGIPASAAPAPQVTDPKGDARTQSAGADIVSVLFGTQGTTSKVGRKTVYTPSKLVVTVTYAAAPSADPYVGHVLTFVDPGCGRVYLEVFAGDSTWGDAACLGEGVTLGVIHKVSGNSIVYTVPLNALGKGNLKVGSALTNLTAYTAVADPVLGIETQELAGESPVFVDASIDHATSAASYKIG